MNPVSRSSRKYRRPSPRLPWKRGPSAWEVGQRATLIRKCLEDNRRQFFSLRRSAKLLGISTQPLREWIKKGHIKRTGPRQQIAKEEISRFLLWLEEKAEPYSMLSRVNRFCNRPDYSFRPFDKLRTARFVWPKGRKALSPSELAALIPCHPSLITKAIKARSWYGLGKRRTQGRWQITKRGWTNSFYSTLIEKSRRPTFPTDDLISTHATVGYLQRFGAGGMTRRGVCELIKRGQLEAVHRSENGRKWYVKKESLTSFLKKLKKSIDT